MFHYDKGLRITRPDLAVDITRRQPRAFVSHAHFDHMGRHVLALCTPETSELYQFRLGTRDTRVMQLGERIEWGGVELTAYPAGHCLGSAMLYVNDGDTSLLYTGDFKLSASLTAKQAELPQADILVIESTYGNPQYRFPPRHQVVEQLLETVAACLAAGKTPVIEAYALGKAQEVTRILTDAGRRVWQAPPVYAVSRVYEQCGMPLGDFRRLDERVLARGEAAGDVLIVTPGRDSEAILAPLKSRARISTTGWALSGRMKFGKRVDHAIPLSDHADYDELLEAIDRVAPREIYCTHGPKQFVRLLRDEGLNAFPLEKHVQQQLF